MEQRDLNFTNTKLPVKSVAAMFCKGWFLPVIAFAVVGMGFALDWKYGEQAFNRSGAALTMIAIFALWLSVHYSNEQKLMREINRSLHNQLSGMPENPSIDDILLRLNHSIKDQDARMRAANTLKILLQGLPPRIAELNEVNEGIISAQILWGLVGTFIWAFGDIVMNLLIHCGSFSC